MQFDSLTVVVTTWALVMVLVVMGMTICKGCCIKKLLRKPCPTE